MPCLAFSMLEREWPVCRYVDKVCPILSQLVCGYVWPCDPLLSPAASEQGCGWVHPGFLNTHKMGLHR